MRRRNHFKIRRGNGIVASQLYLDEAVLAQVLTQSPYDIKRGRLQS